MEADGSAIENGSSSNMPSSIESRILELEALKQAAASREDYETAARIKKEIDALKTSSTALPKVDDPFSASGMDPFAGPTQTFNNFAAEGPKTSFEPVPVDPFAPSAADGNAGEALVDPFAPSETALGMTSGQSTTDSVSNPFEKSSFFDEDSSAPGNSKVFDAFDESGNPFGEATPSKPPPPPIDPDAASVSPEPANEGTPTKRKSRQKRMSTKIQELAKNFGEKVGTSDNEDDANGD